MGRIPKAEKERALLNESLKNQQQPELQQPRSQDLLREKRIINEANNNLVYFNYKPSSSSSSSTSDNNSPKFTTTTNNNISTLISNNYLKYHHSQQPEPSSSFTTTTNVSINTTNDNKYFKKNRYFDTKYSNDIKLSTTVETVQNHRKEDEEVSSINSSTTITKSNNDISFSYLISEIDQLFYKHCKKIFQMRTRAENLIKLGKLMNDDDIHFEKHVSLQHVWAGLVQSIPTEVKNTVGFAKEIPGISDFKDLDDFAIMIDKRLFDFYLVKKKIRFFISHYYSLSHHIVSLCIFTRIWRIIFVIAKWCTIYKGKNGKCYW